MYKRQYPNNATKQALSVCNMGGCVAAATREALLE